MADYEIVSNPCAGDVQHSANRNTTYDVPWTASIRDDQVCVRFVSATSTNVSVNPWVEDTAGNGALSAVDLWVPVPPNGEVSVRFTNFGLTADGVTPRTDCLVHTVLRNDDNPDEGAEISYEIH